jgi:hypothetical protein
VIDLDGEYLHIGHTQTTFGPGWAWLSRAKLSSRTKERRKEQEAEPVNGFIWKLYKQKLGASIRSEEMMMSADTGDEAKTDRIRKLIHGGVEIAGGAVGGALGFLAGGPVGAVALGAGGAAAAMVLRRLGQEASERLLGPRELVRVGAVLAIVAAETCQRISDGDEIRTDGFFDPKDFGRSDGDEVAESVLLKSQREPEEKKIIYMGHLLSSVAFEPTVSANMAHQLAKVAEQLTYRQLCILKLAVKKQAFALRATDYRHTESFEKELYQVLYECLDLYHRAFVGFEESVLFGPTDVAPGKMTIQGLGVDLYNLMRLSTIPDAELAPIAAQLK